MLFKIFDIALKFSMDGLRVMEVQHIEQKAQNFFFPPLCSEHSLPL